MFTFRQLYFMSKSTKKNINSRQQNSLLKNSSNDTSILFIESIKLRENKIDMENLYRISITDCPI